MNKKSKISLIAVFIAWFLGIIVWYLHKANFAILMPRGLMARQERGLMIVTVLLAMIVVIPVYILTFAIAWRYREGNKKSRYQPELNGNWAAELVWWGIPTAIILALSVIAWNSSHTLDPHRALASNVKPLQIQVVALDWKWLFIYPEQHIAAVNFMELPVNTPINLSITADAPMNSFWIPQLSGQIYAMPGMSSPLHIIADKTGDYTGSSANLSGKGFAGMHFTARADSIGDFNYWVQTAKNQPAKLGANEYAQLARPSENVPVTLFGNADANLYGHVILKYMAPEK